MTREEEIEQSGKGYCKVCVALKFPSCAGNLKRTDILAAYRAGAEWAFDYMEHNRLTTCDNMTDEEVEREQKFVIDFLKENNRTPTFSDCIEITRKGIIDKACDWLENNQPEGYWTGGEWLDYIEDFRKIMKGE